MMMLSMLIMMELIIDYRGRIAHFVSIWDFKQNFIQCSSLNDGFIKLIGVVQEKILNLENLELCRQTKNCLSFSKSLYLDDIL